MQTEQLSWVKHKAVRCSSREAAEAALAPIQIRILTQIQIQILTQIQAPTRTPALSLLPI